MKSVPSVNYSPRPRKTVLITLFLSVFITHWSTAQKDAFKWKLSPVLAIKTGSVSPDMKSIYIITVTGKEAPREMSHAKFELKKKFSDNNLIFISIRCSVKELLAEILPLTNVIFVEDAARVPKEEILISNLDLSANKINRVHREFPQWNGDGIIVSVKENKPDTTDIDFAGRFLTTHLASGAVTTHASIMSTMIAGGGNSWHLGKGAAWAGTISSSNFANLLPDGNTAYQQYDISVQNHSYGVGIENFYGADAAAYDASVISNPFLIHIFSSGNSGTQAGMTGPYAGITGFGNITGSFKMSKNSISIGAIDSFHLVSPLSSKGPAHDGRIKPELVAFGVDGSSGSAALVSGSSMILQHAYRQINGSLPANALIKAILLNSADDQGNPEVDYSTGFGSLNTYNAVKTLQGGRFINGSVGNGGSQDYNISLPPGIKKLKLTLVWNDPPAAPNATKALINDLDLELRYPATGQSWQPWVLNKFPNVDSLNKPAERKKDTLNNAEQVTLLDPAPGNYQFRVTGSSITTATQSFSIAYQFDSSGVFAWEFPTSNDFIFSSASNTIRWKSSYTTTTGKLEYSTDGINWIIIDNAVNLSVNYYQWNTPAVITKALLKMTIDANPFVSDSFTISKRTTTGVGFNCPDSFLIYWNKIPAVTDYRIYKLGSRYLEPLLVTADSFVVLGKNSNPSLYYAVAPLIGNREGVKSYTFNYTIQGVECYIRSFLSMLVNNTAQLELLLGTLFGVERIVLEKFDGTSFITLQEISNPASLLSIFIDPQLKKGLNIYRVRIELAGGRIIYTDTETVFYFSGTEFIVYPNPSLQNHSITILSANTIRATVLQVLNTDGRRVYEMAIDDASQQLPAGRLSKGLYFFRFVTPGEKDVVLKVVVL